MKMLKNNLDEMQEKKLLKIEHYGMWIAFWGLLVLILVQICIGAPYQQYTGEIILLMVICFYTLIACLKNGIWDRHLKPNFKTNALISLPAALLVGAVDGFQFYNWGVSGPYFALFVVIAAAFTYLLCLGLLQLTSHIYKKKKAKLENENEDVETL